MIYDMIEVLNEHYEETGMRIRGSFTIYSAGHDLADVYFSIDKDCYMIHFVYEGVE